MQHLSKTEMRLIEGIDAQNMLDQVHRWCAINTGTGNLDGILAFTRKLESDLNALPGDLQRRDGQAVASVREDGTEENRPFAPHLVLSVRPQAERRVLLTGHMDTVFPVDHPFQTLRWLDSDTLNGPGVADMKGGIAVMLAALGAFEANPVSTRLGYDILLNSDEETGSLSSAALIAELAKGKIAALTYEPASLPDGTLAGERAGSGNYALVIRGRSAHAGRNPQDGRNAIVAAAEIVVALKAMESHDLTVNPARIDGGGANNVVPDLAIVRFNIRPQNLQRAASFESALADLISAIERRHDLSIHRHGGVSRPPKPLDDDTLKLFELIRRCGADLGQPIRWQSTGGVCDGNNIAACGVPVVDTLGVRGGAIHSPDEYLIVSSLAERAALSALLLSRIAEGDLS